MMTEQLARRLTDWLIEEGAADHRQKKALTYGLFCILAGAEQVLLLLGLSLLLHLLIETVFFTVFFGALKRTIGGWHADSHRKCLAAFTTLALSGAALGAQIPEYVSASATILFALVSASLVWWKAPVTHPNNPKTPQQLHKIRRDGRIIVGVECAVLTGGIVMWDGTATRLLLCGGLGALLASVALFVPNPSKKGGKLDE